MTSRLAFAAVCAVGAAAASAVSPALSDCGGFTMNRGTLRHVDGCGRERIFRGVNKVNKSPPYYPPFTSFQPGQSLSAVDRALWQSLGFNIVRLGVMASGVLPERGQVNTTYLDALTNITSALYDAGIYTLADAHSDLLSPAFCADGFASWFAQRYTANAAPFPEPLAPACAVDPVTGWPTGDCCGQFSWSEFYFSDAVAKGYQALYTNASAVGDAMMFWGAAARALAQVGPAVLYWELLNEPWPGDQYGDPLLLVPGVADKQNLQPFYYNLTTAIRAAEAEAGPLRRFIMSESITFDDFLPVGFDSLPGATEALASLSFHYYILPNFSPDLQVAARVADAKRLGAVPMLTEFDIQIVTPWEECNATTVEHVLDLCDQHAIGYIGWEYADMWFSSNGSLVEQTATIMSRPYPMAVAGTTAAYGYNTSTNVFTLQFAPSPNATLPTVVFVNGDLHYPTGFDVVVEPATFGWAIEWHNSTGPAQPGLPPSFSYAYVLLDACVGSCAASSVTVTVAPRA